MNKMSVLERFESKVTWDGGRMPHMTTSCYGWTSTLNRAGRGVFRLNKKTFNAAKVAWILYVGDVPDKLFVLHHCDNILCARVEHLYLGTNTDNANDCVSRGRNWSLNKTHCPRNHPYDEVNTLFFNNGWRRCRLCHCARENARRTAKKEASLA